LDAKFIRVPDPDHVDSFIYIDGIRRSGHRMLVAGIFEKLFSSDRPISVFPENLTSDRRLSDVYVSQFDIADGWVAIALAPRRSQVAAEEPQYRSGRQPLRSRRRQNR
jgi:hypothetical protein